jgi:hypothetical protein
VKLEAAEAAVLKDRKDKKVLQVLRDQVEAQDLKEAQDQLDHKEVLVIKELQELKDLKEHKDLLEIKELQELKDLLAVAVEVLKDKKVRKVLQDQLDLKVTPDLRENPVEEDHVLSHPVLVLHPEHQLC